MIGECVRSSVGCMGSVGWPVGDPVRWCRHLICLCALLAEVARAMSDSTCQVTPIGRLHEARTPAISALNWHLCSGNSWYSLHWRAQRPLWSHLAPRSTNRTLLLYLQGYDRSPPAGVCWTSAGAQSVDGHTFQNARGWCGNDTKVSILL